MSSVSIEAAPRDGLLLPDLTLARADGGETRLRSYRGRRSLALLLAHGPDCADCVDYLRGALERYAEYAEEQAEFVAVIPGEAEQVTALRAALGLPFPVLLDPEGAAPRRYGLRPGDEAGLMITDRYGVPRQWAVVTRAQHDLPPHEAGLSELRYLAIRCSA